MHIKELHAHFLISIGDYSNERIGFTVKLEENETPEEIIPTLRDIAIKAVGPTNNDLYDKRRTMASECRVLELKLRELTEQWNATAEFLRAQGLKADAPTMPQFKNLLNSVIVESETVAEFADDDDDNEISDGF